MDWTVPAVGRRVEQDRLRRAREIGLAAHDAGRVHPHGDFHPPWIVRALRFAGSELARIERQRR
jgi:hypothetical protein